MAFHYPRGAGSTSVPRFLDEDRLYWLHFSFSANIQYKLPLSQLPSPVTRPIFQMPHSLFRSDVLQFVRGVDEIVGIGFWHDPADVRLLYEVLVALFLGEGDGILLCLEVDVCSLHEVTG